MIKLFQVSKRYGRDAALTDLSLHIRPGEFVFLTGPSGAGKTTLLRLLFRHELPSAGQLLVDGRQVPRLKRHQVPYHRRGLGVVFQDFKLLAGKTVIDNVGFPLRVRGVPVLEMRSRAYLLLQQMGLADKRNYYPRQLSGGEQQRVAVARALITNPKIVLADEPTGNLDAAVAVEVLKLLVEAKRRGATVVVATHNPNLVASVRPRRLLELEAGRLVRDEVQA